MSLRIEAMQTTVHALIRKLSEKDLKLALAESMTCGLAAQKLSGAVGTSEVLTGSIVCYSPEVKCSLLKVPQAIIDKYTCESMEVTVLLAKHLGKLMQADVFGAVTGLASPGGSETKEKPVGTVFLCVYHKKKMHRERKLFRGSPLEIKKKACEALYKLVLSVLKS